MRVFTTLLINVAAVAFHVPGMLEGMASSVVAGIICSVCLGITATFGFLSRHLE
jgi:hypothetical protein